MKITKENIVQFANQKVNIKNRFLTKGTIIGMSIDPDDEDLVVILGHNKPDIGWQLEGSLNDVFFGKPWEDFDRAFYVNVAEIAVPDRWNLEGMLLYTLKPETRNGKTTMVNDTTIKISGNNVELADRILKFLNGDD